MNFSLAACLPPFGMSYIRLCVSYSAGSNTNATNVLMVLMVLMVVVWLRYRQMLIMVYIFKWKNNNEADDCNRLIAMLENNRQRQNMAIIFDWLYILHHRQLLRDRATGSRNIFYLFRILIVNETEEMMCEYQRISKIFMRKIYLNCYFRFPIFFTDAHFFHIT